MDDLVNQEGVHYQKFSDVPFTGKFVNYRSKRFVNKGCGEGFMLKKIKNKMASLNLIKGEV